MAKFIFKYATMGSGKSREIISLDYNYKSICKEGLILVPSDDFSNGFVRSNNGEYIKALKIGKEDNLYNIISLCENISYVIVDECNFLTVKQVSELSDVVDILNIDVLCYGILTDFQTNSFPSSRRLFEIADKKEELSIRKLCPCGKKAVFNARFVDGKLQQEGDLVVTKDKDVEYIPLCRSCYKKKGGLI